MKTEDGALERFVALSVVLTGYERVDLYGTGLAGTYWKTVTDVVGPEIAGQLLATWISIDQRFPRHPEERDAAVRAEILASFRLGPVARNIIQLWYLGSWVQLPGSWRSQVRTSPLDTTRVVSAEAYEQSLIYQVMRAHPPGARQPGYGSWSMSPEATETSAAGHETPHGSRKESA
jgi:hypothetical protein